MNTNVAIGTIAVIVIIGGLFYISRLTKSGTQYVPYSTDTFESSDTSTLNEQPSTTPMTSNANIEPVNSQIRATLKTNKGDIAVMLDGTKAPVTVGNFVQLARADFYDGTTFHRIIPDFMIQGGDPYSKDPAKQAVVGSGDPGYKFEDEINSRKLVRGSLAMANSGPNTNGSQFFIVTTEATPWLDGLHTNFGEVVSGMEVVDAISAVQTGVGDRPVEPVVIDDVILESI
ncbi:MAG: peptidylprolyl isomerase [Candidatus Andersenbacteria bacterium]